MASLWFKDGKLVFSGGKLTFCGSCPCNAPCTCPCAGTWPAASWPCGNLLESYSISGQTVVSAPTSGSHEYRLTSVVVTATNSNPFVVSSTCLWDVDDVEIEYRTYDGSAWGPWTTTVSPTVFLALIITPTPCRWAIGVRILSTFTGGNKYVGETPVGSYGFYTVS